MDRRQASGWLILGGLGGVCLVVTILTAVDPARYSPFDSLWSHCCWLAESLPGRQAGTWYRASLVVAVIILPAYAARNLALRISRTRRVVSKFLEVEAPMPHSMYSYMEELGLQGLVRVVDLSHPTAFCYGLLRPRICVSSALVKTMSPAQLRAILLHERHHMKRWHPLITLGLDTLADALFFLPLVGELRDQFRAQMELKADRAAIQGAGRKPLAGALHRLLTHSQPLILQSGIILNSFSATQARIDQLLDGKPLGWRPSLTGLASIAPAISLACLLLMGTAG